MHDTWMDDIADPILRAKVAVLHQSVQRGGARGDLCLSGGAIGADLAWGRVAVAAGMSVLHWSFQGHRVDAGPELGSIARISDATLEAAAGPMRHVAQAIKRQLSVRHGTRQLLLRNWFQVAWSDSLYAISKVNADDEVAGGTAWAVQAFRQRGTGSAWVFCQERAGWLASHEGGGFQPVASEDVPVPQGIWAGIGTRDIDEAGLTAIDGLGARMLMSRHATQP